MTDSPLRLGLIGAGRWSRAYLKTASALHRDCRIIGVARRQDKPLDPPYENVPVFTGWRALLDQSLDGLIVATPPSQHGEPACAALDQGVPVMIEKPLTLDLKSALAIRHAALTHRVPVLVDHTQTFHPAYRHILEHTRNQRLDIQSLSGSWGTFRDDCSSLWDWGAHDVAMAIQLSGSDTCSVKARCLDRRVTDEGIGERFRLELQFNNGSTAALEFGNVLARKTRRLLVRTATDAWLYDDWTPPSLYRASASYRIEESPDIAGCAALACGSEMPLTAALGEFCRRVRARDESTDSLDLGVGVVRILSEAEAMLSHNRID